MRLGLALARVTVGGLFVGHGLQKLAGMFGGHGLEASGKFFEGLGLRPGKAHAFAAGAAEAGGGALLAAGACTPLAATALSATMVTATRTFHAGKGPWITNEGYEYNLVLLAIIFAITDVGPGRWSLDAVRGRERWGVWWAIGQLLAGVAGSAAVIAYGKSQPAADADAQGFAAS